MYIKLIHIKHMKYTITKEETKEVRLSPSTLLALDAFKKYIRAEAIVEKREQELNQWLSEVPTEDMEAYVEITEEMRKRNS